MRFGAQNSRAGQAGCQHCKIRPHIADCGRRCSQYAGRGRWTANSPQIENAECENRNLTLRRVELSICHDFEIAGKEAQLNSVQLHSGLSLQLRTQKSGAAENSSYEVRFLTNNQFSKVQIANCKLNTPRVTIDNILKR